MTSDAQSLDPPNFVLVGDFTRDNLLYEGLVRLGKDNKIEPALATQWTEVSPTEWDFTLREGVTFHDGAALDSTAVKKSLERAAKQPQGKGFLSTIKEVQTPDPMTARIVLTRPFSALINNLTVPVAAIISPKALDEKDAKALAKEPVGTGPYKFVSWTPDTKMTFEANREYWGEKATLDRVEFIPIPEASTRYSALQAGDVDVIESPPPDQLEALKSSADLQPITEPKARPIFIGFNLKTVKNPLVRKAVAHAIDRDAIVGGVLEDVGKSAAAGIVPATAGSTDLSLDYDPAKAKALLKQAGVTNPTLSLTLPTARYLKDKEIGEVLQRQLADVGITLTLDIQEPGTWYQSLMDHNTEMYYLGWALVTGDASDLYQRLFRSDSVTNMSDLQDSALDQKLASLDVLKLGSPERDAAMEEIEARLVADDAVVIPLYFMENFFAASKKVKGFHTTLTELIDLSGTTID